jgi:hypothetical protein
VLQGPVRRGMVLLTPAGHMDQAGSAHISVCDGHDWGAEESYSAMGKGSHSWLVGGRRVAEERVVRGSRRSAHTSDGKIGSSCATL